MAKQFDTLPLPQIRDNLDRQIAVLEGQLQRLKHLRFSLDDTVTFQRFALAMTYTWDELLVNGSSAMAAIQTATGDPAIDSPPPREPTRFEQLAMYFKASRNDWASIRTIAAEAKVKESIVRDVLYKTHKDRFERQNNPDGRGKLFRLAEQTTA